eukprot:gene7489-8320_t
MLREVLEHKSSLGVAKRIYSNELKIGVYTPKGNMPRPAEDDDATKRLKRPTKWRRYGFEDEMYPQEKVERMQQYTKSLEARKENNARKTKATSSVPTSTCPFSMVDPRANRLATLFSVYGEQSSDSYRRPAKGRSFLPPVTQALKTMNLNRWKDVRARHFADEVKSNASKEGGKTSLPMLNDSNTLTGVNDE